MTKTINQTSTLLLIILSQLSLFGQDNKDFIITSDIDYFWAAYDKVVSSRDTIVQLEYLNKLYFNNNSEGLNLIMQARNYTPQEYLTTINSYPLFWSSVRNNTLKSKGFAKELKQGVEKLKIVYPSLKETNIYFTMGALRTPGTSIDKKLLVGCELAMADSATNTSEFVTKFPNLKPYFATNPIRHIVFLTIHEYIHSQQKTEGGYDLLSQSVFEGIAEFVPVIALKTASPTPAIQYGKDNNTAVRAAFEAEIFSPWIYNWIWNSADNEFEIRDLGYYVGYAIAEKHYQKAKDKNKAIKELIELDCSDAKAVEAFVEKTGYLSKPIKKLKKQFEKSRPTVIGIKEFKNGAKNANPNTQEITIFFSEKMDKGYRSMDFGKLGKDFFPKIISAAFAEDGKSVTYKVELKPNQKYQMVVEQSYRNEKAIPLKPYLIEFSTGK